MIRLGLRLTFAGGREAVTRLALIAVAVAIGTGLFLTTLASINAVKAQNARYAWLETGFAGSNAPIVSDAGTSAPTDPLWWELRADYYQGQEIGRVDLAATGTQSPRPPGIPRLPGPGQYYASPAMANLLRAVPAAQLGTRYPGRLVGTIGPAGLPSPNSLLIVVGHTAADLSRDGRAGLVNRISTTGPADCGTDCAPAVGFDSSGITLILSVVAAALLFPVLIFIGGATRLSAARREQRFAAMRLVGATPAQVSMISTVESAVAAATGTALGFGLYAAVRPAIASIAFTGSPFFRGDLSLSRLDVVLVALGIPIAAAVAARLALRRVTISPLGVTRRVTPAAPRAWRVLPVLAGLGLLAYFAYVRDIGADTPTPSTTQAAVFLTGVLLVMAGLVVTGPWLTMVVSRLAARRARGPAGLIAARRLADNPQAGFRAISGLVLAVFVGTCAIGVVTAIAGDKGITTSTSPESARSTLVDVFGLADHVTVTDVARISDAVRAVPGVTAFVAIRHRTNPLPPPTPGAAGQPPGGPQQVQYDPFQQLVACADLVQAPVLGHCPPGAAVVAVEPDFGGGLLGRAPMAKTTWPAVALSAAALQALPVDTLVVGTDGSTAAVEQARTLLDLDNPTPFAPQTMSEIASGNLRLLDDYQRLADVVILASLAIAGCSLAVNVAGGLAERKRPFSLLRLTGAPLRLLQRVVSLEAAAPLLVTAAVAIGTGFYTAELFLRAQLRTSLQAPRPAYYVVVAAGLAASLAVIASTLPLLKRITGPETARND